MKKMTHSHRYRGRSFTLNLMIKRCENQCSTSFGIIDFKDRQPININLNANNFDEYCYSIECSIIFGY